jgi:hypothetical protein
MRTISADDQKPQDVVPIKTTLIHSALVFLGFSLLYGAFFSPVIFSGRLLAPGDGLIYYVPAFYGPKTLWTDLISAGYPLMADPQNMNWYPPAMLLSWIPGSWNAFVILAYVLAGSFAYCYAYTLTSSILAAIVTGVIFSMSGFMMSHLGHITMIHAAAWMPLFICAIERLRHRFSRFWWAIGVLALACCFLGGHPQMILYMMGMGFFYALFLGGQAVSGRWQYYRWVAGLFAVGLGLCAIQILPTAELSSLSVRSTMTFGDFSSFSFPKKQTLQLLFPYLFGSGYEPPYGVFAGPFWGEWFLTEITGYVGLLPIPLVIIALLSRRNGRSLRGYQGVVLFWFWFGLIALILTFGRDIFLGRMFYHVPLYNKFRAPARHFVEYSLAVSVLAGFGIAAIQRRWVSKRVILRAMMGSGGIMLLSLISMIVLYSDWRSWAATSGFPDLQLWPWKNPAVGIPLVLFGLGIMALSVWSRWRDRRWSQLLLIVVLMLDVGSFGWFWEWQVGSPQAQRLQPVAMAGQYRDQLNATHQRLLSDAESAFTNPNAIFPNMTRLWGVPNASGYSPLLLSRVSELMQISSNGSLLKFPATSSDRSLDLMAVKYLLMSSPIVPSSSSDMTWAATDLQLSLGNGACAPSMPTIAKIDLADQPRIVTEIGLVSSMGCSVTIPDGAEVAKIQVTDTKGKVTNYPLLAGRDVAETAYDCSDVRPKMQHQRPPVFKDLAAPNCLVHQYVKRLSLPQSEKIRHLEIKWTYPSGVLQVNQISLFDRANQTTIPISRVDLSSAKWKKSIEQVPGNTLYINNQVLPRTWLVSESIALKPEQILTAIRTSKLPDGRQYDPSKMALVEDSMAVMKSSVTTPTDRAEILKLAETQVKIQTQSAVPTFLILSDVYYPGWKATIDGQPTKVYETNYVQRGVQVPAGDHVIEYRFDPMSFKIGAGITLASGIVTAYWLSFSARMYLIRNRKNGVSMNR